MPCYSTISQISVDDLDRLARALAAEGYTVDRVGSTIHAKRGGRTYTWTKTTTDQTNAVSRAAVLRKYAELGVRDFAYRRGFQVAKVDGNQIRLKSRR